MQDRFFFLRDSRLQYCVSLKPKDRPRKVGDGVVVDPQRLQRFHLLSAVATTRNHSMHAERTQRTGGGSIRVSTRGGTLGTAGIGLKRPWVTYTNVGAVPYIQRGHLYKSSTHIIAALQHHESTHRFNPRRVITAVFCFFQKGVLCVVLKTTGLHGGSVRSQDLTVVIEFVIYTTKADTYTTFAE